MERVLGDVEVQHPEARKLFDDVEIVDAAPKTAHKKEKHKKDKKDSKGLKEKKPKQGKEDDIKKKKRKHDGMNGLDESLKLKKVKQ